MKKEEKFIGEYKIVGHEKVTQKEIDLVNLVNKKNHGKVK